MTFPEKLQQARRNQLLTQVQLAERVGVTSRSIQNYEMGARFPKREILFRICEALNLQIETLVGNSEIYEIDEAEKLIRNIPSAKKLIKAAGKLFYSRELTDVEKESVICLLNNIYHSSKDDSEK